MSAKSKKSNQIGAGEFKARCLSLIDEVARGRRPLVITKRGKALVKLVPFVEEPTPLYGSLRGRVKIKGDIVAPTGETWDADE